MYGAHTAYGSYDGTYTYWGDAGSITITCGTVDPVGAGSPATTTCSSVFRLPAFCASLRKAWIAASTSGCCAATASPICFTQSGFSYIHRSTSGYCSSAWTPWSHVVPDGTATALPPCCST